MNKKMSYGLIAVSTLLASLPATLASANDENLKTTKDIQPVSTNTEKHAERNETTKISPYDIKLFSIHNTNGFDRGSDALYRNFDLTTQLTVNYPYEPYQDKLTYEIVSGPANLGKGEIEIPYAGTIDFSDATTYPDGEYILSLRSYVIDEFGSLFDTGRVKMNIERVNATIDITGTFGKINPSTITVGSDKTTASNIWKIIDTAGNVVATESSAAVSQATLNQLPEGVYTVETTATLISKYGNPVLDTTTDSFLIRHPESTTSVVGTYNPTSITGTKKITESSLTWEVKDSNGTVLINGTGDTVPVEQTNALIEGSYSVFFTEHSPENETSVSEGSFKIRHPETTISIDRPINPKKVTGTQKIADSTLTWQLLNETGAVVLSGNGPVISEKQLASLTIGKYEATFIETSPEGETHSSTDKFLVRHPETTTTIDRPFNPHSIKGTQTIAESALTWVLKDAGGKLIESGTGTDVPTSLLDKLAIGNYIVTYTETSPENEIHSSQGEFTIRHPETTTTVNKPFNPDKITGTQTISDSELVWIITDSQGAIIKSGTGSDIPTDFLSQLKPDSYHVTFAEKSPEGEMHTSTGDFIVRHPETTTTVNKPFNPNKITGTQTINESELTWVITDKNGKEVISGIGSEVPEKELLALLAGDYTVTFTEISPEDETHSSHSDFTVRHPEATITIDKNINPEKITGTQTIEESALTWEILDIEGNVLFSGIGSEIPNLVELLKDLDEGSYFATFTETSPEGEIHTVINGFQLVSEVISPLLPEPAQPDKVHPQPETIEPGDDSEEFILIHEREEFSSVEYEVFNENTADSSQTITPASTPAPSSAIAPTTKNDVSLLPKTSGKQSPLLPLLGIAVVASSLVMLRRRNKN